MASGKLLDLDEMRANFGGDDDDLFKNLAESFMANGPEILSAIQTAVHGRDAKGLQKASHSIKSVISIFGAKAAVAAAQELEDQGREGRLDGVDTKAAVLAELIHQLENEVETMILTRTP